MKPYYDREGITIYHADCRDVLPALADGSIDLVLTDPPYNVRAEDIELRGRAPMLRDFGAWDEDWHPQELLSEASRLLVPGGSLLSFTSDRILAEFRVGPLKPRGTVVWWKTNPAPHPRPQYVSATEWIVWLSKPGAAATWNGNGYVVNVLREAACGGDERGEHPTQKPIKLVRELTLRHSNPDHLLLDPFMGTGTTLRAAKDLGRRAVGIEIEERWCEDAATRLSQEVLAL